MWAVPVYVVAAIAGAMTGCALIWRPEERDRVPMRAKVLAIVIAIVAMVVSLYMVGALGQSGSDAVHWVAVAVPACAGAGAIVAVYRMAYE